MINRHVFWKCPNCSLPLLLKGTGYSCDNGHSFDRAKQGYCNFLLANQKNSKSPGDDQKMIDARRAFLQGGYYDFLVDALVDKIFHYQDVAHTDRFHLLDLGCGEGYYLNKIYSALENASPVHVKGHGIDISKAANKRAAALYKNMEFVVASTYSVPVVNTSVDVALSIFSPFSDEEVQRILNDNGIFIRVSPGPRHLYQIKEKIYEQVRLHEPPAIQDGFELIEQFNVDSELVLTSAEDVKNLLGMTPLNWHGHSEEKEKLTVQGRFTTEVSFNIQIMKRG